MVVALAVLSLVEVIRLTGQSGMEVALLGSIPIGCFCKGGPGNEKDQVFSVGR